MSLSYALSQIGPLSQGFLNGDWSLHGGLIWITSFGVIGLVIAVVALTVDPTPRKRIRTLPPARN